MYKISNKVLKFIMEAIKKFIMEAIKKWKLELTVGRKTSAEVKIQWGIFHADTLLQLLFVIAMMSFNYILWNAQGGYKFTKLQEKINYFMHMNNEKLLAKNKKDLETLIQEYTARI